MPEFLSPEWIAALDAAARDDGSLHDVARDLDIVIQQTVTGIDTGERPDVVYHVALTPSDVGVHAGPATDPTICFTTDLATARSIATGTESAQSAFIDGRLRVGGDLRRLLDAQTALARLGDTLSAASHA